MRTLPRGLWGPELLQHQGTPTQHGCSEHRHPSIRAGYHFLPSDTKKKTPHLAACNPNHITNKEEYTQVFKTSGCCATTAIKYMLTFSRSAWRETDSIAGQRRTRCGKLGFLVAQLRVATSKMIHSGSPRPESWIHPLQSGCPSSGDTMPGAALCPRGTATPGVTLPLLAAFLGSAGEGEGEWPPGHHQHHMGLGPHRARIAQHMLQSSVCCGDGSHPR